MDTRRILVDLRAHRDSLTRAIAALEALSRPMAESGKAYRALSSPKAVQPKPGGRISPEGMARIIAATKARWARVRAAKSSAAERRTISAAGRKAMSEASKRRWAAYRKGAGLAA